MPFGSSIPVTKFELDTTRLTVLKLGRLQFAITRQLKVPIFRVFWGAKGVKFSISSF